MTDVKVEQQRKRRRIKTFQSIMSLHNMLLGATGHGLERYQIHKDELGRYPSPWTWPHLNAATDQGPNMVCMDGFLGYKMKLNYTSDWDPDHGSQHDTAKDAIKAVGLWKHLHL